MEDDFTKYFLDILIPTFNGAKHITETLQALCTQIEKSEKKISVSVFDNASTDTTKQIVANFIHHHQFVRIFNNERNFGPDFNYMNAAKESRGDFFWFFSDDDLIKPDGLNKIVQVLEELEPTTGLVLLNCEVKDIERGLTQIANVADLSETKHFNKRNDLFLTPAIKLIGIASTIVIRNSCSKQLYLQHLIGSFHVHVGYVCAVASSSDFKVLSDIVFTFRREGTPRWHSALASERFQFGFIEAAQMYTLPTRYIKQETERRILNSAKRLFKCWIYGVASERADFFNPSVKRTLKKSRVSVFHKIFYFLVGSISRVVLSNTNN